MTSENSIDFARELEEAGYDDVLVLRPESYRDVFTEKRLELVFELKSDSFESMRDLASSVNREPSAVQKDLKRLAEADVVTFEEESNRKIPKLRHQAVTVQPILQR